MSDQGASLSNTAPRSSSIEPAGRYGVGGGQKMSFDRKLARKTLAQLWPFIAPYKLMIVLAFLALVGATSATLTIPLAVRMVIDQGFTGADGAPIDAVFFGLIAVVCVLSVMSALRFYLVTWTGERIVADLRAAVFERIMRFDLAFHDKARSGELISRLTSDATQMKSAVGSSISIALRNAFMFVGASVMMVVTSPALSSAVLLAIPLIVLPLIIFGRKVRSRSRIAQDVLADASAMATEAISSVRTVQAHAAESRLSRSFRDAAQAAFEAARQSIIARALLTCFAIFIIFSSVVLVLWYGAESVSDGRLTAGELGQFLLYALFAAGALGEVSQVVGDVAQAVGAADRLCGLLKIDVTILKQDSYAESVDDRQIVGRIEFDDVRFGYREGGDNADAVLKGVSFDVQPGATVALVGHSGTGKSTVLQLLLRFYDVDGGSIRVDGSDIRNLDPRALREHVALVPQDVAIFAATVRENVAFARPGATDEQVRDAIAAANASSFVDALPQGLDTPIGERGVTLSGGERQRLAIARAVLQDAPILLLDEATSALDAESEMLIQEALDRLMVGRTVVVIAHRLATVRNADEIIVLDKGQIAECGTHASLIGEGGIYARLANLQFTSQAA
ncbi:MAG: ABC transporter transmembrane domain-containing protein [Pseudomonadota bacterium]